MRKKRVWNKIVILTTIFFAVIAKGYENKVVIFPLKKAVLASKINSVIEKINIKEGETFKEGDILVTLENSFYKLVYYKNQNKYQYAKKDLENFEKLFKKNMVGEMELERAKLEVAIALSDLNIAKENFDACIIKAPFSGRFVAKAKEMFEAVRPAEPVCEIIYDKKLLAKTNIKSEDISQYKIGMKLKIKVDETKSIVEGVLYSVAAEIHSESRSYEIKILIYNKDSNLLSGMSGVLLK